MGRTDHKQALKAGYELKGYRVVDVLGVGGFGVTYLAHDPRLERRVAIKEYLPNEFAVREGTTVYPKSESDREDFQWGLARFLDEARTLARFKHPNLVRVLEYFELNKTAYIVMDYEEGESLDRLLERHGTLSERQLRRVLIPIVEGLREVHAAGYLHRDIKPSNIYVRRSDESPVLLDFGAARQALGRKSKSLTAVASAGYSPPEQYESEGEQGPWTDIYALSALCYRAITGDPPMEAPRRQSRLARGQPDPLPKLVEVAPEGYSQALLGAVDAGLRVIETERPGSLDQWVAGMQGAADLERRPGATPLTELSTAEASVRRRRPRKWWLIGAGVIGLMAVALPYWFPPLNDFLAGLGGQEDIPPAIVSEGPSISEELASDVDDGSTPNESSAPDDEKQPILREPAPPESQANLLLLGGGAILVVETDPLGAEVLLDGSVVGETPFERSDIRAGTYVVTLRHPNYQTARLEDQTFNDGEVLRIEETLIPGVGKLTVLTQPRGVWIERDGERLAQGTPVTLEGLPAGMVELTLGADEHRSIRVQADVPKDGVGRLERTLERIPYGTLTLDLVPTDAEVSLPDVSHVYRPGVRLPEGEHRVVVRRSGYRDSTRTLMISGDTQERIELQFDPQPFTVETVPTGASVSLVDYSEQYRDGILLEPGEYRIEVNAPEYEPVEETVSHGAQPTQHRVVLQRWPQPFTIMTTPAEATVEFVGHSEAYVAGMRMAPGNYAVRVSARGYEAQEVTVQHGTEPTQHRITLAQTWEPAKVFVDTLRSGGESPEMVVIPAGSFRMGCVSGLDCADGEKPVHTVRISRSFALSKYEVTFSDWEACVRDGDCRGYRPDDKGWGLGNRPVINVSWEDAQSYVSWLSRETGEAYRLPSEAEWEYAARAGSTTKYSWGNDIGRNRANCDGCGSPWDASQTAPVGSFGANAFGLHDMHGNVWEWVEDCWNGSYSGAPSDGSAWLRGNCERRVLRGGSWVDVPRNLRSANRIWGTTGFRFILNGFRVARTLTP